MKSDNNNKQVKWLPFFSICGVFIFLGTIGWLLKADTTPLAIALVVMGGLTTIANFFPPDFNFRNYWYSNITSETHIILIVLAVVCSIFLILFVAPKYEIDFSVKKKK